MKTTTMGFDEILALGDLDLFLEKTKELCNKKLYNKNFYGTEKEDVVQEVLFKVYQTIDSYDSTRAKASTFFENVINNKILDCLRHSSTIANKQVTTAKELLSELDDDCDSNIDAKFFAAEDTGYVCTEYMLDFIENIGLDEREKRIFNLRCAGYDFVEIAKLLNLTKARISQLWKGILKKYEGV